MLTPKELREKIFKVGNILSSKFSREHYDRPKAIYRCLNGPAEAAYCLADLHCNRNYSSDTIEDEVIIWTKECVACEQDTKIGGLPIRQIYADWPLRPDGKRALFIAQFDLSKPRRINKHLCMHEMGEATGGREGKDFLLLFFRGDSSSLFFHTPYLVISSRDIIIKRLKVNSQQTYGNSFYDFTPEVNADVLPFELCGVDFTLKLPLESQQLSPVATRVFPSFIKTYENFLSDGEARAEIGAPLLSFAPFDGESNCADLLRNYFPFDADFWDMRDFGPICIGDLWSIVVTESINNSKDPLSIFDIP